MKTALPQETSRAATLAVGTEITDGQISDRNSQWLSSRIVDFGYEVIQHRAVPDDREKIGRALVDLAGEANLVLITGGLGPTSDDFTRECIADFLGEKLEWHEPSWARVLERLQARGSIVTENQKQQCFFPRGSVILANNAGTANAFTAKTKSGLRIVALPGPPSEIEAVWNDGLAALIASEATAKKRMLTLLRTMGRGEGAIANLVESVIDRLLVGHAGVERPVVGYRAHAPYVEIKLWAEPSQAGLVQEIAHELRREFSDILVNEGNQDVADEMLARLATEAAAGIKTVIYDSVTQGVIYSRLLERAKEKKDPVLLDALAQACTYSVGMWSEIPPHLLVAEARTSVLSLAVANGELELSVGRGAREKQVNLPKLATSLRSERGRKWAAETAFRIWSQT